ncbi:MAG: hypothetical protein MIN69_24125 [Methylorubrum extorquens]|uniref:Uncharacterized protein n=2 Tax=Methylorubrum extorquens TaxID=408 RepID=C7CEV6_METED|nr:hypothetical protein [Methylorubrum extorquens]EHP91190.1 hypothetical protein MetexDRAFT_3936 [Methylorubrum extorquens DSM 13060]KQO80517.1 hypothetical protein ASF36_09910 [Methylobacterium sp. Leaf90]MCG5248741.1 hypothetical protein [Methylorubrum extorquens]CAX22848.1 protein of unknown function [Methylorubrum extorquens DM4]
MAALFHDHPVAATLMVVIVTVDVFVAALDMLMPFDIAVTAPVYIDTTGPDIHVLGQSVTGGQGQRRGSGQDRQDRFHGLAP